MLGKKLKKKKVGIHNKFKNLLEKQDKCSWSIYKLIRRIEEENEKKRLEGTYNSHKTRRNNEDDGCVQMDASKKTERDRSTNTREQRAKIAGVSAGTVARYDTVMNVYVC